MEEAVGGGAEPVVVEAVAGFVGEVGQVEHVVFDDVVEEVGAEGDVGDEVFVHGDDFADDGGAGDFGKGDGDAEGGAEGSPAAGADEHEAAVGGGVEAVEAADEAGDGVAVAFGQGGVAVGGDVDDAGEGLLAGDADDGAVGGQEGVGAGGRGGRGGAGAADALEEVDAVGAVAEEVEGELDVHGVLVGGFEQFEHPAQVARDGGFAQQAVEGDQGVIAGGAGEVEVEGEVGAGFDDFFKGQGDEFVVLQVEAIHAALGVLAHVVEVGFGAAGGGVERDQAGVVVVAAVHGAGAEAEDQAQDAGLGEDVRVPGVGVEGEADAGGLGVVVAAVGGAADAHDEQGHAFLAVEQAAPLAVEEGLLVEDAGIDAADGVQQALAALLARAAVGDEDAFVFAGEGVAAGVFEDGAGADDVGGFAEVVQQALELFEDGGGEVAGLDAAAALGQALEEGGGVFLLFAQPPDIVLHQEGDEHLGAHEERVVRLQAAGQLGVVRADDGAGDEHAEGFAADGADADHAVAEGQEVVEGEVAFDQAGDAGAMHAQGAAELAQQVVRAPGRGAAGAGVGGGGWLRGTGSPCRRAVALEARPLGAGEDGARTAFRTGRKRRAADVERVHHVAGSGADLTGRYRAASRRTRRAVRGGAVVGLRARRRNAVAVEAK